MRIVHLVAGAGEMYCGSCLQAAALAAAQRSLGHDVLVAPLYTPLSVDDEPALAGRIALGGINVFLQQLLPVAARLPAWVRRRLDSPRLLGWVGRMSGSTRPEKLGGLTLSMLRGDEGRQRREVADLAEWLAADLRPDLVHLNTALLCGVVRAIAARLRVPVVATLSGEDGFIDRLPPPYAAEARRELAARCAELPRLVALSAAYAATMAEFLDLPPERIAVVRPGLSVADVAPATRDDNGPCRIGYLGRIAPEKGVELLVEAVGRLGGDAGMRLIVAGDVAAADRPYLAALTRRADSLGLGDRFEIRGRLDRDAKMAFLQSLDIAALPSPLPESKGLPALEAWAAGVPVVAGAHGALGELIDETGGGRTCRPGDVDSLAAALAELVGNRPLARQLGQRGRTAVFDRYNATAMARATLAVYEQTLAERRQ